MTWPQPGVEVADEDPGGEPGRRSGDRSELGAPFGGFDLAYRRDDVHRRQLGLGGPGNGDPDDGLEVVGVGVRRAGSKWVAGGDPGAGGALIGLEDAVGQQRGEAGAVQRRDSVVGEFPAG